MILSRLTRRIYFSLQQSVTMEMNVAAEWLALLLRWGDTRFKSGPGDPLPCLRFVVVFLNVYVETQREHLKLDHYRFFPHFFNLLFNNHPVIRRRIQSALVVHR
jgi:hypothetical protein